jgi:hypothetical protein
MSSGRLIAASNHQMTGEEMEDLPSYLKFAGMKIFCTQDSPSLAFKEGHYYTVKNDLSGFELDGLSTHNHIDADSGGVFSETLIANIPTTIDYDKRFAKVALFYTSTASGGTVTDDNTNTRIVLDTSATSTGRASLYDGGARRLNFAHNSGFESTLMQSSNTSFRNKIGINAENIEAANNPLVSSYGIEGCSSTGTVWLVWSADGTDRSTTATSAPIVTASPAVYRVEHETANSVSLFINDVLAIEKGTDPPTTGLSAQNNLYKAGIQNQSAAQKILYHYGGPIIKGMT